MSEDAHGETRRFRAAAAAVVAFTGLLWLIHAVALAGGWPGAALGIRPRDPAGLVGIVTAPLVHGSAGHLFSNTLPLLVIGTALLFGSPRAARIVVPVVWLGSGVAVWLFARDAVHLGASGLAYGMLTFVFLAGVLRRDPRSVALTLLVFFLHGSMIWGVLPLREGMSFESHLAGAVIGLVLALALRERDAPRQRPRKYAWEGKEIDEEHPAADLFRDEHGRVRDRE